MKRFRFTTRELMLLTALVAVLVWSEVRVRTSRTALISALEDCEQQKLKAFRDLQRSRGDFWWLQQQFLEHQAAPEPDSP